MRKKHNTHVPESAKHTKFSIDSVAELAAVAKLPFKNAANADLSYYQPQYDEHWFCQDREIHSHGEIAEHLNSPLFQAGVDRIEQLASKLSMPTPKSRRRKAVRSDAGDELDMQRVYQGELHSAWSATRREQTIGPSRVLIVIDISGHYGMRSEELALRGAASLALAVALKEAGYSVSIVAGCETVLSDNHNTRVSTEVQLLAPEHELDLHKLASLVASALLFRGVIIDNYIRTSKYELDSGLGTSEALKEDSVDASGYDYVAFLHGDKVRNTSEANHWLETHTKALQPEV